MPFPRKCRLFILLPHFLDGVSFAASVADPSTAWTVLADNYDYLADQKTGSRAGDIVGLATDPGFFVTFNDQGTSSRTDGTIGFRLRLDDAGGSAKKPAFNRVAWVGIDADIDGDIDAFLGLNLQGNQSSLGIYSPGTDLNNSPSSTSIANSVYATYSLTDSNYNYRTVDPASDGGTTNDATASTGGDPDYYVSFMVPFADIVSFLAGTSITIDDQSGLRYVLATSTQSNSLNQDLGGVDGGVNSTTTWTDLGAFTKTVNAYGTTIPEPSIPLMLLASQSLLFLRRRRIPCHQ